MSAYVRLLHRLTGFVRIKKRHPVWDLGLLEFSCRFKHPTAKPLLFFTDLYFLHHTVWSAFSFCMRTPVSLPHRPSRESHRQRRHRFSVPSIHSALKWQISSELTPAAGILSRHIPPSSYCSSDTGRPEWGEYSDGSSFDRAGQLRKDYRNRHSHRGRIHLRPVRSALNTSFGAITKYHSGQPHHYDRKTWSSIVVTSACTAYLTTKWQLVQLQGLFLSCAILEY